MFTNHKLDRGFELIVTIAMCFLAFSVTSKAALPLPYGLMAKAAASDESLSSQARSELIKTKWKAKLVATDGPSDLGLKTFVLMQRGFLVGFVDSESRESEIKKISGTVGLRSLDCYLPRRSKTALKECANWLKTNFPKLTQENMSSTAAAAEAVSHGDGTIAAIASTGAARAYQLQVLSPNIQDDQHNATNFVVIQAPGRDFPEQNPTRLIVRLDVKKGGDALAQLLEDLKHLSFALTSADSGPLGTLGSHRFALTFDSPHGADLSQVQNTLRPIGVLLIGAYRPWDITP